VHKKQRVDSRILVWCMCCSVMFYYFMIQLCENMIHAVLIYIATFAIFMISFVPEKYLLPKEDKQDE